MTSLVTQDQILIGILIAMVGMAAFIGLLNIIIYVEKIREQRKLEDQALLHTPTWINCSKGVGDGRHGPTWGAMPPVPPRPMAHKVWVPGEPIAGCEPSGRWATGNWPLPDLSRN